MLCRRWVLHPAALAAALLGTAIVGAFVMSWVAPVNTGGARMRWWLNRGSVGAEELTSVPVLGGIPLVGQFFTARSSYPDPLMPRMSLATGARAVSIPLWMPALFVTAFALWARHGHLRECSGACRACGYDLSGLTPDAACPECGAQR